MNLVNRMRVCIFVLLAVAVLGQEDDELADFEFVGQNDDGLEALPNDDYYTETEVPLPDENIDRVDTEFDLFDDDFDGLEDGTLSFAEKEQRLKSIMLKVLANAELKRKFSEVIPMIRVMSSTQRSTLAHLITAQVNAKPGKELTLDQVKQMFGDRPALILPLILDIANMIRTAAQREKFLEQDKFHEYEKVTSDQYLRRSFTVRQKPHGFRKVGEDYDYDDEAVGTVKVAAPPSFLKDSRLSVQEPPTPDAEVAEALPVPEALIASAPQGRSLRNRFVQALPLIRNMKMPADAMTFHEKMLNMSAYNGTNDQIAMPSDGPVPVTVMMDDDFNYSNLTLEEIENLAFGSLNATDEEILEENDNSTNSSDSLPIAEKLVSIRVRQPVGNRLHGGPQRKHTPEASCDKFTRGICLSVEQYPTSLIMSSIKRNRHAMKALLAEFRGKVMETDAPNDEYGGAGFLKRREDMVPTNGMCPSIIRYARPQKARSATGEWKYIVNTGQHTQTLRLEKCSNPQDSCSFLTDNYRSRCIQIFNYHRLLSWDHQRGLHVDIFKVPTCCSCHIDGYREAFPPLVANKSPKQSLVDDLDDDYRFSESIQNKQKIRPKPSNKYSTLNLNYESTESDEEDIAMQFSNGFQRKPKPFKFGAVGLDDGAPPKKQRFDLNKYSKSPSYVPKTLETYLSPPEYDSTFWFKRGPASKPNSFDDQFLAGSDVKISEVTVSPPLTATEYDKIYGKHRHPENGSTEHKISNLKLPNSASAYEVNGKRVNYNYHPILDFFSEKSDTVKPPVQQVARRRVQTMATASSPPPAGSLWRPIMMNGRPRQS